MNHRRIRDVVIVGGGTAGWISAAVLARVMGPQLNIRLIESGDIGIIGVGEATIPPIQHLHHLLGLDENEVMRATQATFKLGIEFVDWKARGHRYSHMFGAIGQDLGILPFYQYWLKQHLAGGQARDQASSLWDFCFNELAARANRFARLPQIPDSPLSGLAHAIHFDAALYAGYLRQVCAHMGVQRTEGRVTGVTLRGDDGFIDSLTLQSGEVVKGDLFIDCSGFQGLLIEGALKAGYEDWTHWLPCDRAIAIPCEGVSPLTPYTRSMAHAAGWQWRIPLQHRIGNGHVFSSAFMAEEEAARILLDHLDGQPLAEPRTLKFITGRRKRFWIGNCVALGLAAGFLEPLESTSIHLAQAGIVRLLTMFPDKGFNPLEIAEYNRRTAEEYDRVRDFIILHYKATERDDSDFWTHCRTMAVPDSLSERLAFFREHGQLRIAEDDLFKAANWVQVLIGQGILPKAASPLAYALPDDQLSDMMEHIRIIMSNAVAKLPDHAAFLARHCQALPV